MKRFLIILILFAWNYCSTAQSIITGGEWFLDQDPGLGQGTAFSNFGASTSIQADIQFGVNTLDPGIHTWHVRVVNSLGRWSQTYSRAFVRMPQDTGVIVSALEWFWDTDPGYGQGNLIDTLTTSFAEVNWTIDLSSMPTGIHSLHARVLNSNGFWSQTAQKAMIVRAEADAPIDQLSYTYKNSSGTSSTFTFTLAQPQHYLTLTFNPDASDLISGQTYDLCITANRTDGQNSFEHCTTFTWEESVGIASLEGGDVFQLYPNPNQGAFQIKLPENRTLPATLQIFNSSGQEIQSQQIHSSQSMPTEVDIKNPVSGMYFAVIEIGTAVYVQKVVIE